MNTATQYVMCPPSTFTAAVPNNVFMEAFSDQDRVVDRDKALKQWFELYRYVASRRPVNLLPTVGKNQDIVFCSNMGVNLETFPDTVIVSNFCSEPRRGETRVGVDFFRAMGYETIVSPYWFEGKADLHKIAENVYLGAYGMRTSSAALEWLEEQFGVEIIPIEVTNPYLYHLDCSAFPIDDQNLLLATEGVNKGTIRQIEEVVNIIPVSAELAKTGATNAIRIEDTILVNINEMAELPKIEFWTATCSALGLDLEVFDLSEFEKGGGALSCFIMPLFKPLI